jgi:ABC-type polysaccharide/polyol phosphate transport system ATPase subunit
MTPYLDGFSKDLLIFETENFKEEIENLGFIWDGLSKNVTQHTSDVLDVDLVAKYNKNDVLLYRHLLKAKSEGIKKYINNTVVSVRNISKKFVIPHEPISTLRGAFVNLFKKKTFEEFYALEDLSFDIEKGEFFGIVGPNGGGKSTLMKILAGVYTTETGSMSIHGLVSPFLELGIGFNPELSGRDNIYLNSTVLGLSKKDIDEKFDKIVAFSEMERFIDQKLKNYSSGMHVRLAFSVAIHANRDILLMDEVLAVGDSSFQKKCIREFHRYRKEGRTVILVSHDLSTIEQYCDRALYLKEGKTMALGGARAVVQKYRDQVAQDSAESHKIDSEIIKNDVSRVHQSEYVKAKVKEIIFEDPELGRRHLFATGSDLLVKVLFEENLAAEEDFNVGVAIFDDKNAYVLGINTIIDDMSCEKARKEGFFEVVYKNIPLRTGTYYVTVGLFGSSDSIIYDFVNQSAFFEVISPDQNHGIVAIDYEWRV